MDLVEDVLAAFLLVGAVWALIFHFKSETPGLKHPGHPPLKH